MAGYTRNDTSNNIATGNVINAADLDGEFDALVAAFHASTGHTHDGTAANGAPITKIGPVQDLVISTGAITPKTDNTVDLGSSSFEFKDLYIDGTANIDALVADTADINAGTIDGVTLGTNSAVTEAQIDNININGNTISSTDTNGNISLVPNGTGDVILTADTIQVGDSNTDVTVTTNGTGDLIFNTNAGTNSGVIRIYDGANGNIALTPNGTGEVDISKVDIDSGAIDGTAIGANSASTGAFTTLSASSTVTLSGGTANGVLYLNGSKVATSGSALTFDGTNLGIGGTGDPFGRFYGRSAGLSSASSAFLEINAATGSSSGIDFGVNAVRTAGITSNTTETQFTTLTATPLLFGINGSEQMRLTSTGLGIGTSSPSTKLDVRGTVNASDGTNGNVRAYVDGTAAYLQSLNQAANAYRPVLVMGSTVSFANNGVTNATLDSSGNLGLGVTPSAWSVNFKALQVGSSAALWGITSNAGSTFLSSNTFFDGAYKYLNTGAATYYAQSSGAHYWNTAPSGTAGNAISFTQAMTLDASGRLLLGVTSANGSTMQINGSSGSTNTVASVGPGALTISSANPGAATGIGGRLFFGNGDDYFSLTGSISGVYTSYSSGAAGGLVFSTSTGGGAGGITERARITSGGYFKASDNGSYNSSTGSYHEFTQTANTAGFIIRSTHATYTDIVSLVYAARNTTNNSFYALGYYNTGAGAYKFQVADSGDVTNTNGTYGTISDAKMKTDIVDAGSQWADVKAIRFRKFKMKDDPSGLLQLGVVAQELEQTSPGLVDEHVDRDAEGNDLGTTTKSVKTSILLMKAAKALQEAMARIETLEAKVSALEGN